jgi:hypothetical protein
MREGLRAKEDLPSLLHRSTFCELGHTKNDCFPLSRRATDFAEKNVSSKLQKSLLAFKIVCIYNSTNRKNKGLTQ